MSPQLEKRGFVDATIEVIANGEVVHSERCLIGQEAEIDIKDIICEPWIETASVRIYAHKEIIAADRESALEASGIDSEGGENDE